MKWKKIIIVCLALVGSFSVALVMNIGLYAENTITFALSNTATGRVNRAPAGITSSSIGIKKGDKFYLQAKNPMDQKPLGWINLGYEADDGINTDYWVAATTEPIAKTKANATSPTYQSLYKNSLIYQEIQELNTTMHANTIDDAILMPRPTINIDKINTFTSYWNDQNFKINSMSSSGYDTGRTPYALSTQYDIWWQSSLSGVGFLRSAGNVKSRDIDFSEAYWQGIQEGDSAISGGNAGQWKLMSKNGVDRSFVAYDEVHAVRAAAALKLSDVVFGIAMDDGSSSSNVTEIKSFTLPATYTGLSEEASSYGIMKLRMLNQTDPMTVTFTDLVDTLGNPITSIEKDGTLFIKAKAENKNSNVSVLIFKDGVFQYYKVLDQAKGNDQDYEYTFDTTGIPAGTYQISIVNEVTSADQAPVYCSELSGTKTINIVNQSQISKLTYTKAHAGESDLTNIYKATSDGNTKQNDILGHISVVNGAGSSNKNSFVLLDDTTHSGDYQSFTIPLDDTTKYPLTDTDKPYVMVNAASGLSCGVYRFRIQAYDEHGNPYPAVNEAGTKIEDTSILNDAKKVLDSPFYNENKITKDEAHGILSNDIEFVVYPHENQISFEQFKNERGEYYKKDDVNGSSFTNHLGSIVFGTDADTHANMQALADAGYTINTATSKLMKKGSTIEQYTYFKITSDQAKPYQFYIDKASNDVTSGDHEFDAWLYFKNAGGDTALLKLTNQNLYIAPSLSFVNPDKPTELLATDTYERKYNAYAGAANTENTVTLIATDQTDHSANTKVTYCLLDEATNTCKESNDNEVVTMTDNGNGTLTLVAKQFHEADPAIKIRASIKDASNQILTWKDLEVTINRAERKLAWEGTTISSLKSSVTKKNNDYELKLPYDPSTSVEYTYEMIANMSDQLTPGQLALRHDAGNGKLSFTLHGNISKGSAADSFTLSDACTGTACYIEVTKPQDDLFEAKTVKLYIVTEDMQEINDNQISWLYSEDQTVWKGTGTTLTLEYEEHGSYPVKINTDILPSDITGLKILYTLDDQDNAGTIAVTNAADSDTVAELALLKANQTGTDAKIKAVLSSNNYAQKTVYLPVHINKCKQTIVFNDSFQALASSIKLDTSAAYDYHAVLKVDATTVGKGSINYTVSGNPIDMISDDSTSKSFTVTKPGTVTITASAVDDSNYNTTTTDQKITKTITFYEDAGLLWSQGTQTEAVNTELSASTGNAKANVTLGDIKLDGGKDTNYTFTIDNTKHSDDSTFFTIEKDATNKAGKLKLLKDVDAVALSTHALQDGNTDTYEWIIHVKAAGVKDPTDHAEGDITIKFTGAEPDITFTNADANQKIIRTYEKQGSMEFSVKRGDTQISDATLTLSGYSGTVDITSKEIKSANTDNEGNVRSGRKTEITASVNASDGYKTGISPKNEIIIKKAEHPKIDFLDQTLSSTNNVEVQIEGILSSDGKVNETVTITPIKADESDSWVIDEFTMTKDQAYETPSIAISPKGYIGIVEFHVQASGDDNYKPLPDQTKITLEFSEAGGIIYKPIEIVYGDQTHHVLDYIISPNPSDDAPTVSYTYTPDDPTMMSISEDGIIRPIHTGKTTLSLKRVDSADASEMEQTLHVMIKPKEVIIQPQDIHKKVGEFLTTNEYALDLTKSGTFENGDDLGTLVFSCQDHNVEVTSLMDGLQGPKELDINASHTGGNVVHKQNYSIVYKPGKLYITQDESQESWVSVIPKNDTSFHNGWYNGTVEIKVMPAAGSYTEISGTGNAPWAETITVEEEGNNQQSVSFKDPTTNAKAKELTKEIKIDTTAPSVKKIIAKSSNNKLEDLLHTISGGAFFKPGTKFQLTTNDANGNKAVSGTSEVMYSIYKLKGTEETELVKDQTLSIKDEVGSIQISEYSGTYKLCTKAKDHAGNMPDQETCTKVTMGYENVNITTGNGECPDLNLDFYDSKGNQESDGIPELNIDVSGDNIPDLNIDTDFDGKPDVNVDSDGDGRPDINLVMLKEWNPGMCMNVEGNSYATQEDVTPEINIVVPEKDKEIKDMTPALNIDTKGDFKPDINITKPNSNKPYLNIVSLTNWLPETNYTVQEFDYDTMNDLIPLLNVDSDGDGRPDLNIDLNENGIPDLNIDVNHDGIPDTNIDSTGDGKANLNIDTDEDGEPDENIMKITYWKPDKNVDGKILYDTMEIIGKNELEDQGITVVKPDGTFLPNFAIKVSDVTKQKKEAIAKEAEQLIQDQEVKAVYDVSLFKDDIETKPDGTIKVRVPLPNHIEHPKVLMKRSNGAYEEMKVTVEDGYLVFETEELGTLSIIGDVVQKEPDPTPSDPKDPEPTPVDPTPAPISPEPPIDQNKEEPSIDAQKPAVLGSYTNTPQTATGMGGAITGDTTNSLWIAVLCMISCMLSTWMFKQRNQ